MLHGMWLGRGKVEGPASADPSCLPGLAACPLVSCFLDEASY